jgi:hypothetical protein
MNTRTTASIAAVCACLVLAFVAGRLSAPDPFRTAVQRIRETPQTRDGEIVDNLTLLGPEGVAAIGRALAEPR